MDNGGDICCCGNVNLRRRAARPTFSVIPATYSGHKNAQCVSAISFLLFCGHFLFVQLSLSAFIAKCVYYAFPWHQGVQGLVSQIFHRKGLGKTSMLLPDYGLLWTIMPKVFCFAHSITFSVTLTLTITKCNVDTVEPGWPLSKHSEIPNISLTIIGYTAHLPCTRDRHRTVVIDWTDVTTGHNFFSKLQ